MKSITNFYQGLDTINLILFWGIIIVIVLLLIFSIILVNKNKKLRNMLIANNYNHEDDFFNKEVDDIPVITTPEINVKIEEEDIPKVEESFEEIKLPNVGIKEPTKEEPIIENNLSDEKTFVAEEHVMEYSQELFNLPNIEKVEPEKEIIQEAIKKEETKIPNAPYQRNILRDRYSNQTSPIGIVKREDNYQKNLNNAKELHNVLNEDYEKNIPSQKYIEEVSQKLNEATNLNDIDRTAYELQQEEEAIISYQELMAKKDHIKMIDEEDAVISIDELMNRQKQKEKLYNITKEEENGSFIDELKQFRNDL